MADRYGVTPEYLHLEPDIKDMLSQADAAVLIGDIGLTVESAGLIELDLGKNGTRLPACPFISPAGSPAIPPRSPMPRLCSLKPAHRGYPAFQRLPGKKQNACI